MEKIEVVNTIQYFTTVGEEIEDILLSNNIDRNSFLSYMNWNDKELSTITKVSKKEAFEIEKTINVEKISTYILKFQSDYKVSHSKALASYKDNLKLYKKIEHLKPLLHDDFNDGLDILEDISNFLDIENELEIFDKVNENIALYKISNFVPDNLNLYAWLKRGELDFYKKNLQIYQKENFLLWLNENEWERNLYNTNYILNELPKTLEKFGIALVYTPYLNKTVFGAVRWFDSKPLIQISDKGKCLATFWYTLFHEFGHVIKHENDEIFEGQSDLTKSAINKKEKEANSFAYNYLFKGDNLRKFLFSHRNQYVEDDFIDNISKRFNVNRMFTAYWMKKALIKSKTIKNSIPSLQF